MRNFLIKQRSFIPQLVKSATRFVRFYRSSRESMRDLYICINRKFRDVRVTAYRHTPARDRVIFLQIANHRSRRGKLLPTRQSRGPVSGLSYLHFEWKLLWSMLHSSSSSRREKADRTKQRFVCTDNIHISTCGIF